MQTDPKHDHGFIKLHKPKKGETRKIYTKVESQNKTMKVTYL